MEENIWNWDNTYSLAESFIHATGELGKKRGPIVLQCPRYRPKAAGLQ